jgi:hypothetical protein
LGSSRIFGQFSTQNAFTLHLLLTGFDALNADPGWRHFGPVRREAAGGSCAA